MANITCDFTLEHPESKIGDHHIHAYGMQNFCCKCGKNIKNGDRMTPGELIRFREKVW